MPAYSELFLEEARANLGEMLEYACLGCGYEADEFWSLFILTGYAQAFGSGAPAYTLGMCGADLAMRVMQKANPESAAPPVEPRYFPGEHYWCGWALAYYQWLTGDTFAEIARALPCSTVLQMYPTLHEAPLGKFVDAADEVRRLEAAEPRNTSLARLRRNIGLSQASLAEASGVKLRTLQQYESRAKDINKAQARTLLALAQALDCDMRDLMEPKLSPRVDYSAVRL